MSDLKLQSKYSPSLFLPDWLDPDRVELEWDRALFIWISYSLTEFWCPPQNYEIYTIHISTFSHGSVLQLEGNDGDIAFLKWNKVSPKNPQQCISLKYCQKHGSLFLFPFFFLSFSFSASLSRVNDNLKCENRLHS